MIRGGSRTFSRAQRCLAGAVIAAGTLALPAAAQADPFVYWSDLTLNTISRADIAGGAGKTVVRSNSGAVDGPRGVAFDRSTGKLYWANSGTQSGGAGSIGVANADGTAASLLSTAGAPVAAPSGVAVDVVDGLVFWANRDANSISYARLDGGGGGTLDTSGAPIDTPQGVAIDRAHNRLYWANNPSNDQTPPATIGYTSLDNTGGGGALNTAGAPDGVGEGVAYDPTSGRVYWSVDSADLAFARVDGSGGGAVSTGSVTVNSPGGVGLDVARGRLYWVSSGSQQVGSVGLDGTAASLLATTGATLETAFGSPAVSGVGVPKLTVLGSHAFGLVPPGTVSGPATQTLTNAGSVLLSIERIGLAGAGGSQYALANDCPATLAPGAACSITTRFTPNALGAAPAAVRVETDAGVATTALSGTGGTPNVIAIVPPLTLLLAVTDVKPLPRCMGYGSRTLAVRFTLSRPAKVTYKLQRATTKGSSPTRACPKPVKANAKTTAKPIKYSDVGTVPTTPKTPKTVFLPAGERSKKLRLPARLPSGRYRIAIRATALDNTLTKSYDAEFWVVRPKR